MTQTTEVRFNATSIEHRELEYVTQALVEGTTSASGPFSTRVGHLLQEESGAEDVMMTTSCTAALELAAMTMDVGPGDVVVVPSFTFTTTALAFVRSGARILFCDIEPDTLGLDPDHLERLLAESAAAGERVRAVVVVHYAGIAADIEGLNRVLADHPDITLVEDNAHGLYGRWRGRPLGSFGRFATLSFHSTKNFTCGEGGALLLHDSDDIDRARIHFDKGTDRQAFFLGLVDKYSWRDAGSSFGLADTLAAHLLGQLECREQIQGKRRRVWEGYRDALEPYAEELGLRLPVVPADCEPAYHLFHVLLPDHDTRTRVMGALRDEGIHSAFHYVPLHDSDGGRRFAARTTECPVSSDVSGRLLRLPFHNNLGPHDVERVAEALVRNTRASS